MTFVRSLSVVAILCALLPGCGAEYVSPGRALDVASGFYDALSKGDTRRALASYSPGFRKEVDTWPGLLVGLQAAFGPVTSATRGAYNMIPKDKDPCFVIRYAVQRGSLASSEVLIVCRNSGASSWSIAGHEMTRGDTKQSIAGGLVFRETRKVSFP